MSEPIEVIVSKPALALLQEKGWTDLHVGLNELTVDQAMEIEQDMWVIYKAEGDKPRGRAAAGLSRNLATAVESTRSIDQVLGEIRTVLGGKFNDEAAVEAHLQLMIHRGWDRVYALAAVRKVREEET